MILGPPGIRLDIGFTAPDLPRDLKPPSRVAGQQDWANDQSMIVVVFDQDGKVVRKAYSIVSPWRRKSLTEQIRFRLRRTLGV